MRMEIKNEELLKNVTGGTDENEKEKEGNKKPQDNQFNYISSIIDPETHKELDEKDKENFIKKYLK